MNLVKIIMTAVAAGLAAGQVLTATGYAIAESGALPVWYSLMTAGLCALMVSCGWMVRTSRDSEFRPSVYKTMVVALNTIVLGVIIVMVSRQVYPDAASWEIGSALIAFASAGYVGVRRKNDEDAPAVSTGAINAVAISGLVLSAITIPLTGVVIQNSLAGLSLALLVCVATWVTSSTGMAIRNLKRARGAEA